MAKMLALKLTSIGNSLGLVLPREVLHRLEVEKGGTVYLAESGGNGLEQPFAGQGKDDTPVSAFKKPDAECIFDLPNLVTDRGLGDAEFLRRQCEAALSCRGLERTQCIQIR